MPPSLADYDVGEVLGKGSFGCARLAVRRADALEVVIKQIRALEHSDILSSMRETAILQELHHPNIIRYIESIHDSATSSFNIVTEYATGGDLSLLIANLKNDGRSPETSHVYSVLIQMAVALKYLHARKILHRDVKPANVFLMKHSNNSIVKMGDFGVSTVLKATQHMAKTFCGTLHYISPEVCEDKPYGNKADIWAVGCCIYEFICLKRAFDSKAVLELGRKICEGVYEELPSSVPEELKNLVAGMLQKNPQLRSNAGKILSSTAIVSHLGDVPEVLLESDRYRMVFSDHDIESALKKAPTKSYEDEVKEMEEWALRDSKKYGDDDAFGDLIGESFGRTKTGGRATLSNSTGGLTSSGSAKNESLSSEVGELLAKRETIFRGTTTTPPRPLSAIASDGDEDFSDTYCLFSSPLTPSTGF